MSSLPGEQTAKSFIDALKEQPLSLALVVMNICLLGFLYYLQISLGTERRHEVELQYQYRHDIADLLSRCTLTVPPSTK